jgi:hypothetical protein
MLWQTSSRILIATATEENNEERRFGAATPNRISVYPEQRPLFLQLYQKEQVDLFEEQLEGAEKKVAEQVRNHELAPPAKTGIVSSFIMKYTILDFIFNS